MKIVLCCAGGFSTTMLMDSMKAVVKKSAKLNEDDFSFVAIPVDILQSEVEDCDVLVIGPQIAHKLDYIKPIIEPYHIPYVIVDQEVYGKMDGATVMKQPGCSPNAPSRNSANSTARAISTRTSPRTTRSASTTCLSAPPGGCTSPARAFRVRNFPTNTSGSPASTSKRTPPNSPTPAASRVRTTTAPACRCWRWSANRICAAPTKPTPI